MRIFLFVVLGFMVFSCGKKQEIRITAINPANGEPWSGLHYSITQEKTGAISENYKVIHEGFLDDNGKAITEVKMKNASYRIDIEDPGNTCYQNMVTSNFSKNNAKYYVIFEFVPCPNLKFRYHKMNYLIQMRRKFIPLQETGYTQTEVPQPNSGFQLQLSNLAYIS